MPIQRKISSTEIYQIKVTLLRTAPPIWRRLLVPSDITLADLHDAAATGHGLDATLTCTSSYSAGALWFD